MSGDRSLVPRLNLNWKRTTGCAYHDRGIPRYRRSGAEKAPDLVMRFRFSCRMFYEAKPSNMHSRQTEDGVSFSERSVPGADMVVSKSPMLRKRRSHEF